MTKLQRIIVALFIITAFFLVLDILLTLWHSKPPRPAAPIVPQIIEYPPTSTPSDWQAIPGHDKG